VLTIVFHQTIFYEVSGLLFTLLFSHLQPFLTFMHRASRDCIHLLLDHRFMPLNSERGNE